MKYFWLQARRWYLAHKFKKIEEPLKSVMASALPPRSFPLGATEFVSLDIETTGLNVSTADMLSVGWVLVRDGRISLRSAESYLVRPSGQVGDSASVHGLTDTVVGAGLDWGIVLDKVVRALAGRVLLVHHAGLDKALLDRMCLRRYGGRLHVPVVDTLTIELRRRQRNHHVEKSGSLRLPDLRQAHSLPRYAAHDCLVDAIGTAELLLAVAAHRKLKTLGDVIS